MCRNIPVSMDYGQESNRRFRGEIADPFAAAREDVWEGY
jgi:hypothetical protein